MVSRAATHYGPAFGPAMTVVAHVSPPVVVDSKKIEIGFRRHDYTSVASASADPPHASGHARHQSDPQDGPNSAEQSV